MKRAKMVNFLLLREKIKKEIARGGDRFSRRIGEQRERLADKILKELEKSRFIRGFVPSGKISFSDVKKGVDFYVVRIGEKYQSIPLSITGKAWVKKHEERHPEIPVIEINSWESREMTKKRIMKAITQYK